MNTIDWGRLVNQGRAKAHGIPWSDEENAALALGIPAEYVREGVLTMKEYKGAKDEDVTQEKETGKKPVNKMNKEELVAYANELGIEFTPEATAASLKEVITAHLSSPAGEVSSDKEETNEDEVEGDANTKENE